jgi:uroporphyrinogen-III decarboxylase
MPIGSDLILHEHDNASEILTDGLQLGKVLAETAQRFHTPLAIPHMDLELEKYALLEMLGVPVADIAKYHFAGCPPAGAMATLTAHLHDHLPDKLQAHIDAVGYIAEWTDLLPIGMAIGPFSLMTKLIADPITPICLAGSGVTAEEDDEVLAVEQTLELAITIILHSINAQIDAGAKAIFIAEPAANKVFISPNQIEDGSDIFTRYVMQYNRRLNALLTSRGVDLLFHCCGEITPYMLQQFCELDPAMLSLGSSRVLWEDAALIPKNTVIFGNLPSKKFYSDDLFSLADVREQGSILRERMREAGHPFILGSECDVLSVPGCEETIMRKAMAIMQCARQETHVA